MEVALKKQHQIEYLCYKSKDSVFNHCLYFCICGSKFSGSKMGTSKANALKAGPSLAINCMLLSAKILSEYENYFRRYGSLNTYLLIRLFGYNLRSKTGTDYNLGSCGYG